MHVLNTIHCLKQYRKNLASDKKIAFVPTMGNLHEGHLSLIKQAGLQADCVIVSIFVNPTQFLPHEDFDAYPRTIQDDYLRLREAKVDAVFVPNIKDIYPFKDSQNACVHIKNLENLLCGASRPGFFSGVCSVLLRLFHLIKPSEVFLGQKDYQQALIVKQMCRDFFLDIKVKTCPIVRTKQGLALSSRLNFLSETEKKQAEFIYKMLSQSQLYFDKGNRNVSGCIQIMRTYLTQNTCIKIDYLDFVDKHTLKPLLKLSDQGLFVFAGYLKGVRLIDNFCLS